MNIDLAKAIAGTLPGVTPWSLRCVNSNVATATSVETIWPTSTLFTHPSSGGFTASISSSSAQDDGELYYAEVLEITDINNRTITVSNPGFAGAAIGDYLYGESTSSSTQALAVIVNKINSYSVVVSYRDHEKFIVGDRILWSRRQTGTTGCPAVKVTGLDSNFEEMSRVINLGGTMLWNLSGTWLRINKILPVYKPAGTITVFQSGNPQWSVSGDSMGESGIYTVPAGKVLYLKRIVATNHLLCAIEIPNLVTYTITASTSAYNPPFAFETDLMINSGFDIVVNHTQGRTGQTNYEVSALLSGYLVDRDV